jgi:hypothetical protein
MLDLTTSVLPPEQATDTVIVGIPQDSELNIGLSTTPDRQLLPHTQRTTPTPAFTCTPIFLVSFDMMTMTTHIERAKRSNR